MRTVSSVGLIGAGNMGSALVKGWLRPPEGPIRFVVWDKVEAATARLVETGRVERAESLEDLAARVDAVLVVVKPKDAKEVLTVLAGLLRAEQTVISSMAGVTLEWMRGILGPGPALYRIMPNLGVELGVGAVALAHEPDAPAAEVEPVRRLLEPLGWVEILPEDKFDAVTGVSGSGPAFLALAIESLEDGAVAVGLSRALARRLVRQTALATAESLSDCSNSPAELRGRLNASGELYRRGMETLEQKGLREAFQKAVEAAVERSRQLR
ncbi:MAG: pyrroline-5-carboxylate reductase [Thermoleophilia bacterium]|nr:pyrroline-5-carboxylate reductase [Thermoleophilia bacterium]